MREFVANLNRGLPWQETGPRSAGNGALMRIAPTVIPHLRAPSADLWADAALCAMITHNDSMSISACVAFVALLWDLLSMSRAPSPGWWVERFVEVARGLELDEDYRVRGGRFADYRGPLWRFVAERLPDSARRRLSVYEAQEEWHSGAYLLETVPSALYVLSRRERPGGGAGTRRYRHARQRHDRGRRRCRGRRACGSLGASCAVDRADVRPPGHRG